MGDSVSQDERPRAGTFLRIRAIWLTPLILGGIVVALMAAIYFGAVKDPGATLQGLPVGLVNQDAGAQSPAGEVQFGDELVQGLTGSAEVTRPLELRQLDEDAMHAAMDRGELYAAVVIPPGFSAGLLALAAPDGTATTGADALQLVTNPRLGTAGTGMATGVLTPAIAAASQSAGQQLARLAPASFAATPAVAQTLADPIPVTDVVYRPLPSNAALGLSAFYFSLLASMAGFLGATLIQGTVDSALGYATSETGVRWRMRRPVPITRWQTLLTKYALAVVIPPLLVAIVLLVAVGLIGMDAPSVIGLWAMMSLGAVAIAVGTLTLLAMLGSLGQLVSLVLFVYLALSASGATLPPQSLPQPFAAISGVDPLHRIFTAVRSIVYFDGQATDGWPMSILVLVAEIAFWVLLAAIVVTRYDRRGLDRMRPELLERVLRASRTGDAEDAAHADAAAAASAAGTSTTGR
jgi:YhgE/Pip-like protein